MTLKKKHCLIFLIIFLILIMGLTLVSATTDTNKTEVIDNKELSTPSNYDVDKVVQTEVTKTDSVADVEKTITSDEDNNTKTITKKDIRTENTKEAINVNFNNNEIAALRDRLNSNSDGTVGLYDDMYTDLHVTDINNNPVESGFVRITYDSNNYENFDVENGISHIKISYDQVYSVFLNNYPDGSYSSINLGLGYVSEDDTYNSMQLNPNIYVRLLCSEADNTVSPKFSINAVPSTIKPDEFSHIEGLLTYKNEPISNMNVTLKIGGLVVGTYQTDSNGKIYYDYEGNNLGTYAVQLNTSAYRGFKKANSNNNIKITVKLDPTSLTLALNKTTVYVGETVRVYGKLTVIETGEPISGADINLTFANDYVNTTQTDSEGNYEFNYTTTTSNNKNNNLKVSYDGDKQNFNATSKTAKLTVNIAPTNATISATNVTFGQNTTIEGVLFNTYTGNIIPNTYVNLSINGNNILNVPVNENGKYTYSYNSTVTGENTIKVTFVQTSAYSKFTNTTTFTVGPRKTNMTIVTDNPVRVGSILTVNGTLYDEFDEIIPNTLVNVSVGNTKKTVPVDANGFYEQIFPLTSNGTYDIIVEYNSSNSKYESSINTTQYTLNKIPTITNVSVVNSTVYNVVLDVSVKENGENLKSNIRDGNIKVTVNDATKVYPITGITTRLVLDDMVNITTTDPVDFKVEFVEDEYYLNSTGVNITTGDVITKFTASPINSRITVFVYNLPNSVGKQVNVNGQVFDERGEIITAGTVDVIFNNDTSTKVTANIELIDGRYAYSTLYTTVRGDENNISVYYNGKKSEGGNDLILPSENKTSYNAERISTFIDANVLNDTYGNVSVYVNVTYHTYDDRNHFLTTELVNEGLVRITDWYDERILCEDINLADCENPGEFNVTLPLFDEINRIKISYYGQEYTDIFKDVNYGFVPKMGPIVDYLEIILTPLETHTNLSVIDLESGEIIEEVYHGDAVGFVANVTTVEGEIVGNGNVNIDVYAYNKTSDEYDYFITLDTVFDEETGNFYSYYDTTGLLDNESSDVEIKFVAVYNCNGFGLGQSVSEAQILKVFKKPSITRVEEILNNKSGEVKIRINITNSSGNLIPTGCVIVVDAHSGELLGEGNLTEGKVDILLPSIIEAGEALVNITYKGNEYYDVSNALGNTQALENTTTITVLINPSITIKLNTTKCTIGESVRISGTAYNQTRQPVTRGSVKIYVDDEEYMATLDTNTGEYYYDYTPKANGTKTIKAVYNDNELTATSEEIELLVNKINSTTSVRVVNNTAGNVTLEISVTGADNNKSMNGELTIIIEGNKVLPVEYNNVESTIVRLHDNITRSGVISVITAFNENDNYYQSIAETTEIDVQKQRPILNIEVPENIVELNSKAIIIGNLTDDLGNNLSNAYVEIVVDGQPANTVKTNSTGGFTLEYPTTHIGLIVVNAAYNGDNIRYAGAEDDTKFTVTSTDNYDLNVEAENITYGNIEKIIITIPRVINGEVNISIPGYGNDTAIVNYGKAEYTIDAYKLNAGEYTVTVSYEDETLALNTNKTTFTVKPAETLVTVSVTTPVIAGNPINITGILYDENNNVISGAKIEIKVDNKSIANVTTDNKGNYKTTITDNILGTHNVEANYKGDNNYKGDSANVSFTVEKLETTLSINKVADVPVGESVVITGKLVDENNRPVSGVSVKVSFDGKTTPVTTDKDGNYKATYTATTVGNKEVTAIFAGNNKYDASNTDSTAKVVKTNATITLTTPTNAKVGEISTVKGKITDKHGKAVANMPVDLTINGKTIKTVTDNNGNFEAEVTPVEGNNPVTAKSGNENYDIKDVAGQFVATRKDAKLTLDPIKDSKLKDNVTVTGKLVDEKNKALSYEPVKVTVNGKTTTVTTDESGNYQLPLTNVVEGTNNVSVKYEDTQYKTQSKESTFKATKSKTKVTVSSVTGVIGEDITLTAYVTDDEGNPVSGGNLVFKLNGRTLRTDGRFDTNNSSPLKLSVKDGKVTYTIKADLYLRNGKNITASYSGSSKYDAAKANVATANIKKRNAQVIVKVTPNATRQNNDIVFTATINDVTPKATNKTCLVTDANIIFKVNGVTIKNSSGDANRIAVTHTAINYVYHVPTGMGGADENGTKDYTVEAVYDNPVFYPNTRNKTTFNVVRSKVNINFIKTSVKKNVLSVKANLTDFEDKYLIGTNKVCVKINGVTYKENGEIKYFTVKEGRVNISGIKLASGTKVKNVMLVTGAREGYLGARATTDNITA